MVSRSLRRGVFPGSFNPLTIAHLDIARQALVEHHLDEVHLVVSMVALDKPTPPGPPLDERIQLIDADLALEPRISIHVTDKKLIVDISEGYDAVIMGADKWHQVNDVRYYHSEVDRDDAIARMPKIIVAHRSGAVAPEEHVMHTPAELHDVSSTDARQGRRDLMAPHAAEHWAHTEDNPATGPLNDE